LLRNKSKLVPQDGGLPPGEAASSTSRFATYYCALGRIPSERWDDLSKRRICRPGISAGMRFTRSRAILLMPSGHS
ncbi:MAG: hypothetical protein ABJO05_10810, partial [Roseibium sp.]